MRRLKSRVRPYAAGGLVGAALVAVGLMALASAPEDTERGGPRHAAHRQHGAAHTQDSPTARERASGARHGAANEARRSEQQQARGVPGQSTGEAPGEPWEVAEALAGRLRPAGGALHDERGGAQGAKRPVWGDTTGMDADWLRVKIPVEPVEPVDEDEHPSDLELDAPVYLAVVDEEGRPLDGYDPVAFAEQWDPSDPHVAVFDDTFREGIEEFDPEWPLESIVVTIELMVEREPAIADALRELLAEEVPALAKVHHETTRELAFEIGRHLLAEAPELPEVMAIAGHLIDVYDLGGLMAMYVAKAAWVVLSP